MVVEVKDRQSLLDIAVQTAGSMEAAFMLSKRNDVSLTDILEDRMLLNTVAAENPKVVNRYSVLKLQPATALSSVEIRQISQEGINFMGIEIDFIVS